MDKIIIPKEIQDQHTLQERQALSQLEVELEYITSTTMGRRVFLSSLPLLIASCAQVDQTRYREGNNKGQATSITVEDEKKMTAEYLPQLRKDYPLVQNRTAQQYIADLGNKIVRANNLVGHPYNYHFSLVQSKQINAFALPAGQVMVTAPLLAMANSEAELAGVVGHEIGHIVSRHSAERIEAQKKTQSKSILYGLGGALLGGAVGFGLGKALCKKSSPDYKSCMSRISQYGVMAGGMGGLMIQKFGFMANSREDEMEADRVGFRTSVKAGYDKDHVGLFYSKLLQMEEKRKAQGAGVSSPLAVFADALSTHPPSKQRVSQMNQMASSQPASPNAQVSTRAFEQVQKIIKS